MSDVATTTEAAPGDGQRPAHLPETWMSPEAMAEYITDRLEHRVLSTTVSYGQLTVDLEPSALPDAAELCKRDERLDMNFFDCMAGVDRKDGGFAVMTRLYSIRHRHEVRLRVVAPGGREEPALPTITHLYRGANWHEREVYDMFGIVFEGHPGLHPRILTVENFEGWPLRKEFLLTTREAKPWPGLKEPKEADADEEDLDGGAGPGSGARERTDGGDAGDKAAAAKAKAERAKAKAAEMRAKKARERAAEQEAGAAQDVEGAAAAQVAVGKGEQAPQTPEGAAEIADSGIAKDAAAGAPSGDTAKGAPEDEPGIDEPVRDRAEEERVGEGAEGMAAGAPGVEAEGRHGGAKDQAGDVSAADTPGMTSPTQRAEAARTPDETPAPGPESDRPTDSDAEPHPEDPGGPSAGTRPIAEDVEDGGEGHDVATEPSRERAAPPPVPDEGEENQ